MSAPTTRLRRATVVFIGGGCGATLRAMLLVWLAPLGVALPLHVLLVNLLGAFALGLVVVLADEAQLLSPERRLFLSVGVLGGFTTFSTFGWGTDLLLAEGGHWRRAALYVALSVCGGVIAVWSGGALGRRLTARRTASRAGYD